MSTSDDNKIVPVFGGPASQRETSQPGGASVTPMPRKKWAVANIDEAIQYLVALRAEVVEEKETPVDGVLVVVPRHHPLGGLMQERSMATFRFGLTPGEAVYAAEVAKVYMINGEFGV